MIRYAIADMDGRSHAYFDDRAKAREALYEIQAEDQESIDELYLVGYASNGKRVYGPEAAADALRSKMTLQPSARQWATVETRLVVPPKKRLRYKKPSRSKPFDPCDKLALT
jgi:hypothetical protein